MLATVGSAGETGVIRIGDLGTHTTCYIQGVDTVVTAGAAVPVLVDADGQFGTVSSAKKYKKNIVSISEESSARIYGLNPVTFNFIKTQRNDDGTEVTQFGLLADDVIKTIPEIVIVRKGEPETIRYDALVPLLLAEVKRLAARVVVLEQRRM
jgi:hypothetical protein